MANRGKTRTFVRRGVADLYSLLNDEPGFLDGAAVADKVVGKAAAALMILGGVRCLHTRVISRPALELLGKYPLEVEYDVLIDHISNRSGDGWCPLEIRCRTLSSPHECYKTIQEFILHNAN